MSSHRPWTLSLLCLALAACQQSVMVRPADEPATTASRPRTVPRSTAPTHTVAAGDTLYKISVQYGVDYRDIAAWNQIDAPYTIYPKQVLRLAPPGSAAPAAASAAEPAVAAVASPTPPLAATTAHPPSTTSAAGSAAAPGYDPNLGVTLPEGARPLSSAPATGSAPAASSAPTFEPVQPPSAPSTSARPAESVGSTAAPRRDLPAIDTLESAPPPSPATTASLSESGVAGAPRTAPAAAATPASAPGAAPDVASDKPSAAGWIWPTSGKVVGTYASGDPTRQGVDVAGTAGQPVRAARDGEVVYSGAGLIGYGELIIIKHSPELLSAYGHNRVRLVKEGQKVKAGQKIAEMGRSPANRDLLHFEIRRNGKPVDPLPLLPAR